MKNRIQFWSGFGVSTGLITGIFAFDDPVRAWIFLAEFLLFLGSGIYVYTIEGGLGAFRDYRDQQSIRLTELQLKIRSVTHGIMTLPMIIIICFITSFVLEQCTGITLIDGMFNN